jgi:hypothetical protein
VSPIVSSITTSFEVTLTVASKASQTNDQRIFSEARKTSVSRKPARVVFVAAKEHAFRVSPSQRSLLFREVNDRIYDLLEETDPDLPGEFLCECGRDCGRRVELLPAAFAMLRKAGGVVGSADCTSGRVPVLS